MNKIRRKKSVISNDGDDLDVYVDGQLVLRIGQVSDDEVINLFFYPKGGNIIESMMHRESSDHGCTHELLCKRKSVEK